MTFAHTVKIQRVAVGNRTYDAVTVHIGGLHLRCDAVDARTIRLGKRLANDHSALFMYDDEVAPIVRDALGVSE